MKWDEWEKCNLENGFTFFAASKYEKYVRYTLLLLVFYYSEQ